MSRRRGHHRPHGTTTRIRLDWTTDGEPELADVAVEIPGPDGDPADLEHCFLVVGVEEGRDPGRFNLVLERRPFEIPDDATSWAFYRHERRAR